MQADVPAWVPEGREGRSQEALPALSAHLAHPTSCILHCRGAKPALAKPAAAKPAASKADYSRPRQTIADQGRPWQSKAFWNPRCYQHLRCLYYYNRLLLTDFDKVFPIFWLCDHIFRLFLLMFEMVPIFLFLPGVSPFLTSFLTSQPDSLLWLEMAFLNWWGPSFSHLIHKHLTYLTSHISLLVGDGLLQLGPGGLHRLDNGHLGICSPMLLSKVIEVPAVNILINISESTNICR